MAMNEDAFKEELLQLYRNNYALREDQQAAKQMLQENTHLREEIDVLRREKLHSERREEDDAAHIQALKAKIADLRKAAVGDASKITTIGEALEKVKKEKRELETENADLEDKNDDLNRLLEQSQAKVAQLESQLAPIGSRPFPLKRPARVEGTGTPVQQTQDNQAGSNLTVRPSTRRKFQGSSSSQSTTDDVLSDFEDLMNYVLVVSDGGESRGPSPRKRRRAEKASGANDADDADDAEGLRNSEITPEDLRAAFPDQVSELDAAKALKGTWGTYRVFELSGRLLALLDLSSARGVGLHKRFARPLGAAGRTVQLSAWDVLAAAGGYKKVDTYRIQHARFTRMRGRYEQFFEHASGAQRLQHITNDEARKILEDVSDFFNGQPSARLSVHKWDKHMKMLDQCLGDKTT